MLHASICGEIDDPGCPLKYIRIPRKSQDVLASALVSVAIAAPSDYHITVVARNKQEVYNHLRKAMPGGGANLDPRASVFFLKRRMRFSEECNVMRLRVVTPSDVIGAPLSDALLIVWDGASYSDRLLHTAILPNKRHRDMRTVCFRATDFPVHVRANFEWTLRDLSHTERGACRLYSWLFAFAVLACLGLWVGVKGVQRVADLYM